jgi:D-arabinose 1-dehydrogenase-like Zn-dependent alcohol dehydrogenase
MAIKIAASFGCEVTAISTTPAKEAAARAICRAVQVEPMKPMLNAPGTKRLKL